MGYLRKRFQEASTWAAIAGLIPALMQVAADPSNKAAIGSAVAAGLGVLIPDDIRAKMMGQG